MNLAGKTAIVTGGGRLRGIGFAAGRRFAREGANVVLVDINKEQGEEAAASLRAEGARAAFYECDVTVQSQIESVVARTEAEFGVVDVLLNNAGIHQTIDFLEVSEADFSRVMTVNVNSVFLFTQAVARRLVATGKPGSIINISSVNARMATPRSAAYAASKGAVSALTAAIAIALADKEIRVNAIGPGTVETEITTALRANPEMMDNVMGRIPLGRIGKPEEMAALACFLASDDSSYITGQTIFADGGRMALSFSVPKKKAS